MALGAIRCRGGCQAPNLVLLLCVKLVELRNCQPFDVKPAVLKKNHRPTSWREHPQYGGGLGDDYPPVTLAEVSRLLPGEGLEHIRLPSRGRFRLEIER